MKHVYGNNQYLYVDKLFAQILIMLQMMLVLQKIVSLMVVIVFKGVNVQNIYNEKPV